MKPKTKIQKEVALLSDKFNRPGLKIVDRAYNDCFKKQAIRWKSGRINCLHCGHFWKTGLSAWQDEAIENQCPNCKTKFRVVSNNKRIFHDEAYFGIITAIGNYQVIRNFKIRVSYKCGKIPTYFSWEIQRALRVVHRKILQDLHRRRLASWKQKIEFLHCLSRHPQAKGYIASRTDLPESHSHDCHYHCRRRDPLKTLQSSRLPGEVREETLPSL